MTLDYYDKKKEQWITIERVIAFRNFNGKEYEIDHVEIDPTYYIKKSRIFIEDTFMFKLYI